MVERNTLFFWKNMDAIQSQYMTPDQIIGFLEGGAIYRAFSDVLRSVCPGDGLQEKLKKGLYGIYGITPGTKEADSMDRNIRNWLAGRSTPQNREDLFRICFALKLDEQGAGKILASASETGIHYRNPRELIYAFCLRTGRSYAQAQTIHAEMEPLYLPKVQQAAREREAYWTKWEKDYHEKRRQEVLKYQKALKQGKSPEPFMGHQMETVPTFLTQQINQKFEKITTVEGLKQFLLENSENLGIIHESAYEKVRMLLLTLTEPDDWIAYDPKEDIDPEADLGVYSLDRIADVYLRMNVPKDKKTKDYTYLQKAIKKNWPGPSDLQKMKARQQDVDRKTLLLLFIATEDYLYSKDLEKAMVSDSEAAQYIAFETDTPRDELEITISKLNMFLSIYGMNMLDPGNPFDCLVLYAIAAEYGSDSLGDPFSEALAVLFQNV